jgi:hypothetical protein
MDGSGIICVSSESCGYLFCTSRILNISFINAEKPEKITSVHKKRAVLAIYLFLLQPVSAAAITMLLCIPMSETCSDDLCTSRLQADYSVECSHGDYLSTQFVAILSLFVIIILVPAYLVTHSRKDVRSRNINLKMRYKDVSLFAVTFHIQTVCPESCCC